MAAKKKAPVRRAPAASRARAAPAKPTQAATRARKASAKKASPQKANAKKARSKKTAAPLEKPGVPKKTPQSAGKRRSSAQAAAVNRFLAQLPEDRRTALLEVRRVILDHLDPDYEECLQFGMIGYCVTHRVFPPGYHANPQQPLMFAALGSQKNYMTLHLPALYVHPEHEVWFRKAWAKSGKRLDMGKACIRFKKVEALALDVIGEVIRREPARAFVEHYLGGLAGKKKSRA